MNRMTRLPRPAWQAQSPSPPPRPPRCAAAPPAASPPPRRRSRWRGRPRRPPAATAAPAGSWVRIFPQDPQTSIVFHPVSEKGPRSGFPLTIFDSAMQGCGIFAAAKSNTTKTQEQHNNARLVLLQDQLHPVERLPDRALHGGGSGGRRRRRRRRKRERRGGGGELLRRRSRRRGRVDGGGKAEGDSHLRVVRVGLGWQRAETRNRHSCGGGEKGSGS